MNKKAKTPIELMAELLAEMTERATTAERERDAAKQESANWYQHYKNKDDQLKAAEASLTATSQENKELRLAIQEYIELLEKTKKE